VELVHRSSIVVTTLNLVSKILCVWGGGLNVGHNTSTSTGALTKGLRTQIPVRN
jgi:hypothetical protein